MIWARDSHNLAHVREGIRDQSIVSLMLQLLNLVLSVRTANVQI
jgi:hypothetical protein